MKKERSHSDDVRGMEVPFEAPDGTTIRRVVTAVMIIAVGVIIAALISLAFHYKAVSDKAQEERVALSRQLEDSTKAITNLLEFQKADEEGSQERLKGAIDQVVEEVTTRLTEHLDSTQQQRELEHNRIIEAVEG